MGRAEVLHVLKQREPEIVWPARSTVSGILERHGLVKARRRRKKWEHPGAAPARATEPNEVWPTGFKGQFKTGDGIYCYPLTIADLRSRYLLRVHALLGVKTER